MKILTVGRIAPIKNYEVLIEAAKILQQRGVHFSVTIVGESALKQDEAYEKRIRQESAGLNFQFVRKKTQSELPKIYQEHDIFVHMSRTGSLDKVVLEAMACGIKVLSCNEASRNFLPANRIFYNSTDLAEKILRNEDDNFDGRQYALDHHDLKKLISRISALL